jgi:hypothetical protein
MHGLARVIPNDMGIFYVYSFVVYIVCTGFSIFLCHDPCMYFLEYQRTKFIRF